MPESHTLGERGWGRPGTESACGHHTWSALCPSGAGNRVKILSGFQGAEGRLCHWASTLSFAHSECH